MKKLNALTPEKEKELDDKLKEHREISKEYWGKEEDNKIIANKAVSLKKDILLILLSQLGNVTDFEKTKLEFNKIYCCGIGFKFKLDNKTYIASWYSECSEYTTIIAIEDEKDYFDSDEGKNKRYTLSKDMFINANLPKHKKYKLNDIVRWSNNIYTVIGFSYQSSSIRYYLNDRMNRTITEDEFKNNRRHFTCLAENLLKPIKGGL